MASKFGGIPVSTGGSRFGGVPVRAAPGSPEDDARRVAQGGRPYAEQNAIAERDAAEYQRKIAENQTGREIGRTLALGGRSVLRGIASIPDLVISPLTALANKAGEKAPTTESLITGQQERYFPRQMNVTESVDYLADLAGAPRPETPRERVLSDINSAIVGTAGGLGVGQQLSRSGNQVASRVGQTLLERPGLQTAAAVSGATASGVARESGAGPVGQAVAGLAGGLAVPMAAGRSARLPTGAENQRIVATGERMGIPVRPAGLGQGKLGQAARGIPGTGATKRYEADVMKANDKLAELIGAPRGTPPERVYPEALARNSAEFDHFAGNYALQLDQPLLNKLLEARNSAQEVGGVVPKVRTDIDKFLDEVAQTGSSTVPGDLFKRLDTQLGAARGVGDLKSALRAKFRAGMPAEEAKRWDSLMRRYGDMKTVERLYANLPKTGGRVDPRAILTRINATKHGASRMAAGTRGELGELAKVGQAIVPPQPVGISTVGIPAAATVGGGAGLGLPGAAAGYGLANILGRLADRPYTTQSLSRMQALEQAYPGIIQGNIQQDY
jgi:hypothetical protein